MKVVLQKPEHKIIEGQSEEESSVLTKKSEFSQKRASLSIIS